jgi:choline dehydrogenase-like flavoprotein
MIVRSLRRTHHALNIERREVDSTMGAGASAACGDGFSCCASSLDPCASVGRHDEHAPNYGGRVRRRRRSVSVPSSLNSHRPLILNGPEEIDAVLTPDLVSQQRIQITSGHPMGGCALGGNARRDVVDSRGRSWDVEGLYIADSSILPTSLGVNPCYTVYALGRYIAHKMVDEIHSRG